MQSGEQKRRVAVFDIDGTLFRSSLVAELVEMLVERGIFPPEARKHYERQMRTWLNRELAHEEYIQKVVETFVKHIKGVHYGVFADACSDVVDGKGKHIYTYTGALVKELKERGYFLLAISTSPKAVVDKFCTRYGFDKVYGTVFEIGPQDCFTGTVIDPHLIHNKAAILKRAIEKEHLILTHSVGVGDTEGDISFLEMVARPICFNPNAALYRHAKRMKWKVVVERKDVVYEM